MKYLLTVLALCTMSLSAQNMELWEAREYKSNNGTRLPYRMLSPATMVEGQSYPLVIFLHGSGERGSDNEAQLKHVAKSFDQESIRAQYPAFVIFPQLGRNDTWSNGEYDQETATIHLENQAGDYLAAVMDVIDEMEAEFPIDTDRIYLGGLSMGGFGTWDALSRWPWRFAAAFPICGIGDPTTVSRFQHVPIWVVHGDADVVVPVEGSRLMVEALRATGAAVIYSEFPEVNHNSWDPAFDTQHMIDWIFAQRK